MGFVSGSLLPQISTQLHNLKNFRIRKVYFPILIVLPWDRTGTAA